MRKCAGRQTLHGRVHSDSVNFTARGVENPFGSLRSEKLVEKFVAKACNPNFSTYRLSPRRLMASIFLHSSLPRVVKNWPNSQKKTSFITFFFFLNHLHPRIDLKKKSVTHFFFFSSSACLYLNSSNLRDPNFRVLFVHPLKKKKKKKKRNSECESSHANPFSQGLQQFFIYIFFIFSCWCWKNAEKATKAAKLFKQLTKEATLFVTPPPRPSFRTIDILHGLSILKAHEGGGG